MEFVFGAKAIPLGWTMLSSTMVTAPVEGRKRYVAVSSWGAVSTRSLNQEYSMVVLDAGGHWKGGGKIYVDL